MSIKTALWNFLAKVAENRRQRWLYFGQQSNLRDSLNGKKRLTVKWVERRVYSTGRSP